MSWSQPIRAASERHRRAPGTSGSPSSAASHRNSGRQAPGAGRTPGDRASTVQPLAGPARRGGRRWRDARAASTTDCATVCSRRARRSTAGRRMSTGRSSSGRRRRPRSGAAAVAHAPQSHDRAGHVDHDRPGGRRHIRPARIFGGPCDLVDERPLNDPRSADSRDRTTGRVGCRRRAVSQRPGGKSPILRRLSP